MEEALSQVLEIIVATVHPERVILFGSRAREDQKSESDYDLCVIKKDVKHKRKLAQQIYRSLYGCGLAVDILVETPESYDQLKDNPFMIYQKIACEGKLLYEKG